MPNNAASVAIWKQPAADPAQASKRLIAIIIAFDRSRKPLRAAGEFAPTTTGAARLHAEAQPADERRMLVLFCIIPKYGDNPNGLKGRLSAR